MQTYIIRNGFSNQSGFEIGVQEITMEIRFEILEKCNTVEKAVTFYVFCVIYDGMGG